MSNYLGDFPANATVYVPFTTNDGSGGRVEPSSAFEVADFRVYKNIGAAQRSSESGYSIVSPFDSMVGVQILSIDTSDNTDVGFFSAGNDYFVVLYPDETVDSQDISKVVAQFSIQNRFMRGTDSAALASVCTEVRLAALTDWINGGRLDLLLDAIKAKTDNLPEGIQKNAELANFEFLMTDSTNHAPATGKSVTATRSIDGAAFGSCANSVTEVASGIYKITLAAADLNGSFITLRFTASGCDDRLVSLKTNT